MAVQLFRGELGHGPHRAPSGARPERPVAVRATARRHCRRAPPTGSGRRRWAGSDRDRSTERARSSISPTPTVRPIPPQEVPSHAPLSGERPGGRPGRRQRHVGERIGGRNRGEHLGPPGGRHRLRHPLIGRLRRDAARRPHGGRPRRQGRLRQPFTVIGATAPSGRLPGLRRRRVGDPLPPGARHHVRGGPSAHPVLHRRVHHLRRRRRPRDGVRHERERGRGQVRGRRAPGSWRRPDRQPRPGRRRAEPGQGAPHHRPGRAQRLHHLGARQLGEIHHLPEKVDKQFASVYEWMRQN